MPKKSKTNIDNPDIVKQKDMLPFGVLFEIQGLDLDKFIAKSELEKISNKLGKDVSVISIVLAAPDIKTSVVLMKTPASKKSTIMIAPNKKIADNFHAAIRQFEEKEKK